MKKILKITGFIILGLFLVLTAVVWFFNSRYNQVNSEIKDNMAALENAEGPFYHFELQQDSISELILLPIPKEVSPKQGQFKWPKTWEVISEIPESEKWINRLIEGHNESVENKARIRFTRVPSLDTQAYELHIGPKEVKINYATPVGAYYAVVSLYHLKKQFAPAINCISIIDRPDLEIRGVMLDISRDKVPQLKTLMTLVDQLSLLKYNHLQLYVEGFSFGYPSFKEQWEGKETPITPEEIRELDAYCKERFIELVPNQNSLGHMQAWLETDTYAHLAECPDGYEILPMRKMKTTLDPTNEESIELVEQMMKDLLPNFSSNKFNANLDEPFELGHCNSASLAEEIGVGQVYLDFVLKVYELAQNESKEFWMWGDIINKHPDLLDQLPKDVTVLEWGYEQEHPYDINTRRIKEKGYEFLVCPGTSSWMTLTGRTDNMLGNIENAVLNGLKNGAKGMLLTDWGDMGHWQYLPISYPGFVYASAISWNSKTTRRLPLERYLNTHILNDNTQQLAKVILAMGRSYHFEETHLPNMSHNFMAYQFGITDPVMEKTIYGALENKLPELLGDSVFKPMKSRFDNRKTLKTDELFTYLDDLESDLNFYVDEKSLVKKNDQPKNQIRNELRNGIQMVRLGAEIRDYGIQKKTGPVSNELNT